MFEFPGRYDIWNMDESSNDYDIAISLKSNLLHLGRASFGVGLGYNRNHQGFLRPYDHNYFTGSGTKVLRHTNSYTKHQIRNTIGLQYGLIAYKAHQLFLEIQAFTFFNMVNHVEDYLSPELKYNKWDFKLDGFEINPGVGYRYRRFVFHINYRLYNFRKIDPVIFNGTLFKTNPQLVPFINQNFDEYNPTKFWFSVGYQLWH